MNVLPCSLTVCILLALVPAGVARAQAIQPPAVAPVPPPAASAAPPFPPSIAPPPVVITPPAPTDASVTSATTSGSPANDLCRNLTAQQRAGNPLCQ